MAERDDAPMSDCPGCGKEQPDLNGFGALYCESCGYCEHPYYAGPHGKLVCQLCGQKIPTMESKTDG